MELGFTRFDVSLAGMGGCPVIPNAKGNIPTEDFVNLLHKMDIGCGIDTGSLHRGLFGHEPPDRRTGHQQYGGQHPSETGCLPATC